MAILSENDPLYKELMATEGQAEIIDGKIVKFEAQGFLPSRATGEILFSLMNHEKEGGKGEVYSATVGFLCDLPHRKSFCADVSFYAGAEPKNPMGFLPEPPIFAVEVRNKEDYGRRAEAAITAKIEDYFAAGTLVVWDVDLRNEDVIAKFSAPDAHNPQLFRRGDVADAGKAVPGWTLAVDALFPVPRHN